MASSVSVQKVRRGFVVEWVELAPIQNQYAALQSGGQTTVSSNVKAACTTLEEAVALVAELLGEAT